MRIISVTTTLVVRGLNIGKGLRSVLNTEYAWTKCHLFILKMVLLLVLFCLSFFLLSEGANKLVKCLLIQLCHELVWQGQERDKGDCIWVPWDYFIPSQTAQEIMNYIHNSDGSDISTMHKTSLVYNTLNFLTNVFYDICNTF